MTTRFVRLAIHDVGTGDTTCLQCLGIDLAEAWVMYEANEDLLVITPALVPGEDNFPFGEICASCKETVVRPSHAPCTVCGRPLSPVEAAMGPVCGACIKKAHKEATR